MEFAGMAVAHLAMDPKKLLKSGRILLTSDLAREYGYQDFDGSIHDMLSIRELLNANVIRFFSFWPNKYLPNYFSYLFLLLGTHLVGSCCSRICQDSIMDDALYFQ